MDGCRCLAYWVIIRHVCPLNPAISKGQTVRYTGATGMVLEA